MIKYFMTLIKIVKNKAEFLSLLYPASKVKYLNLK
jgi:hypothetical protein